VTEPSILEGESGLRVTRFLDALLTRKPTRIAPALLAGAMAVSAALCLWVARGTIYSGDELAWFNLAPDLSLRQALEPGSGHLLLIPRVVYALILNAFGSHYLVFRVLCLAAVYLAVALLFCWSRKKVGDFFALAPCVALLFFGTDPGHLLQGNGFTIMLAVSAGLLALIGLERQSRGGDLIACLALCVGVATYSVALAFLAGAIVAVLAAPDRWRRLWVVVLPLGLYLAWRIWIVAAGIQAPRDEVVWSNLVLLPTWTFDSLSGILNALSGLHYNFGGSGWLPPGAMAGPALALAFLVWIGWRAGRMPARAPFWIAVTVLLALFASQVVVWAPVIREPGTSRYLYPGAVAALLVLVASVRGLNYGRPALLAVWLVALTATGTGVALIRDSGAALRDRAVEVRGDITAVGLLEQATGARPGPGAQPVGSVLLDFDAANVLPAERQFGRLGYAPDQIASAPPTARARMDKVLLAVTMPYLKPLPGQPKKCLPLLAGPAGGESPPTAEVPGGTTVLFSEGGGKVSIRRFGDDFTTSVGELSPGRAASLVLPVDDNPTPWQITSTNPDLKACAPDQA